MQLFNLNHANSPFIIFKLKENTKVEQKEYRNLT